MIAEPGSFRDRNGRVYYFENEIIRGLSQNALENWQELAKASFFRQFTENGSIVQTQLTQPDATYVNSLTLAKPWAAYLQHEKIPFITYPYEWCFSMLKDAAILQLELLLAALQEDMILKDSSSYNFQWRGNKPVFIDIPSFEKLQPNEPWVGYRQFCQLFLYPLMLQAYKNVPFQPWLRGAIDGIKPDELCNVMSKFDLLRPGVLLHVYLQKKLQQRHESTTKNIKSELRDAGFSKELIVNNGKKLLKLVNNLSWKKIKSEWSDYTQFHSYTDKDHTAKKEFIEKVSCLRHRRLVWDIGSNTGEFSMLVAKHADCVVAMDSDHLAIEKLYQVLHSHRANNILPIIINLADASPNLGWQGLERKSITDRGLPDLTLCLALIHHIVIGANIPMAEFIQWLAKLDSAIVIEFVTKDDEMVKTLLLNKEDNYAEYELENFRRILSQYFNIQHEVMLTSKSRILFYAEQNSSTD